MQRRRGAPDRAPRFFMRKAVIIFTAFVIASLPRPLSAADLQLESASYEGQNLMVNFSVTGYQRSDILEAIRRGIKVKIDYSIEIVEKSPMSFLYKNTVARKSIRRTVRYDFWSHSFILREGVREYATNNEHEMLRSLFQVKNAEIANAALYRNENHYVRMKAELTSIKLYFPMNYIFKYIVGIWDFDTGWVNGPQLGDL